MIRELLKGLSGNASNRQSEIDAQVDNGLAAAVLLIEVMLADGHADDSEQEQLHKAVMTVAKTDSAKANLLIEEAKVLQKEATDFFRYTNSLHQSLTPQAKIDLLVQLWTLAFANDEIDRYEEHVIRRIADLLYVPHNDFIRSKIIARDGHV
ncbi:MAG: TerB family tellurite resistance protein [Oleibacter sp.]|nr:TerB family tellurite resistance protein [Thalassolituus sp.]